MNLEQMKKIVDGAPKTATDVIIDGSQVFYGSGLIALRVSEKFFNLHSLRTELAKREPMDLRAVDIPHGTIVLEK